MFQIKGRFKENGSAGNRRDTVRFGKVADSLRPFTLRRQQRGPVSQACGVPTCAQPRSQRNTGRCRAAGYQPSSPIQGTVGPDKVWLLQVIFSPVFIGERNHRGRTIIRPCFPSAAFFNSETSWPGGQWTVFFGHFKPGGLFMGATQVRERGTRFVASFAVEIHLIWGK